MPAEPSEEVKPLSPVDLERLIAGLHGRDRAIAVLASHSTSSGSPAITARELKAWRLESWRPSDDQPIIGQMSQTR